MDTIASAAASEDYENGYADGVRDAATWTAKHAADLVARAGALRQEAEALIQAAGRIEADARDLENAAQARWAQWSDRRSWPDVQELVAQSRAGAPAPVQRSKVTRPKKRKQTPADPLPTLNLACAVIAPPEDGRLDSEQEAKRAAGRAWRA